MNKGLQKIFLLIAVITVIAHAVSPHHHEEEDQSATEHHHHDITKQETKHHDHHDDHHGLFSSAELDKDFLISKTQNKTFESPVDLSPALLFVFHQDNFPLQIIPGFGWYKEYPPPKLHFLPFSHRGPPTV